MSLCDSKVKISKHFNEKLPKKAALVLHNGWIIKIPLNCKIKSF